MSKQQVLIPEVILRKTIYTCLIFVKFTELFQSYGRVQHSLIYWKNKYSFFETMNKTVWNVTLLSGNLLYTHPHVTRQITELQVVEMWGYVPSYLYKYNTASSYQCSKFFLRYWYGSR